MLKLQDAIMKFQIAMLNFRDVIMYLQLVMLNIQDGIYLFIYLYLKKTAHLAINASLPCVSLKHIYIFIQVKHMIKT